MRRLSYHPGDECIRTAAANFPVHTSGLDFVEIKDGDRCCGKGGTFSAVYYELSRRSNDTKMDNVEATGADYVVTGCSSCWMHITDGFHQRNFPVKVLHAVEIIDMT